MKIQIVNFKPFLKNADAPMLTPPEMGAAFARYSRNNDGLDAILELVKDVPEDKRVDTIMAFADYGHRSILDLVEVPIVLEGISMYAAARLFQFSKLAAGQESSTRYIKRGFDLLPYLDTTLSIKQYRESERLFNAWTENVDAIPQDASRATRNKTLDKVRYSLPVVAMTNVAIKMSVRAWQETLRSLSSYPAPFQKPELLRIVAAIKKELEKTCGSFAVKHCDWNEAVELKFAEQARKLRTVAISDTSWESIQFNCEELSGWAESDTNIRRKNRYDPYPPCFDETIVSVFMNIRFAELRDLNRHRNRIVNTWSLNTNETDAPTLGTFARSYAKMTLSQLLYEIEIRTSEGAHPSYRRTMNLVLDQVYRQVRTESHAAGQYLLANLFDNQGQKAEG